MADAYLRTWRNTRTAPARGPHRVPPTGTAQSPAPSDTTPLIEARGLSKYFGNVIAIEDISLSVRAGEVVCLLGDNGAGKSTLIKTLSGVHPPDSGQILLDGKEVRLQSPRDALHRGVATVYQDLAMCSLMSVSRNFFLGNEPTRGWGPFKRYDAATADRITLEEMHRMGIDLRDTTQTVGTLSGGERQSVAIARAVHFGAKVVILDEPTSALGVKEAAVVLRYIVPHHGSLSRIVWVVGGSLGNAVTRV